MRPLVGAEPPAARSRKSSIADSGPPIAAGPSGGPTTFFLRTEEEMERSIASSVGKQRESTYGVQSLEDTLGSALHDKPGDDGDEAVDANKDGASTSGTMRRQSKSMDSSPQVSLGEAHIHVSAASSPSKQPAVSKSASPSSFRRPSQPTLSQPPTPLRLESPITTSAMPSTPKSMSMRSFRLSDEEEALDEVSSQAIVSSGEEDEDEREGIKESTSSFPELVMPSIQMPKRRPFTATGKAMGRLKVLIAGEAGVGKTSLIRSIVQICEDIVHVDPLSPTVPEFHASAAPRKTLRRKDRVIGTTKITEISASTKAYPSWWSEMEDSRILRRRKSLTDTVLERNLCFIDTPGFRKTTTLAEDTDPIIQYMEALLHRNVSIGMMNDSDLLGILSGGGGLHVDVVFYLFSHQNRPKDVEYCRRLSAITNVIPLISKADTLSSSQIASLKSSILSSLEISSIKPFLFGKAIDEVQLKLAAASASQIGLQQAGFDIDATQILECIPPFAVSSKTSLDDDTMDASLLMSPDYVQPLIPSELAALVSQVFNPENVAWLRHSAARKFIQWRNCSNLAGDSMLMHNFTYAQSNQSSSANLNNTSGRGPVSGHTTFPTSAASSLLSSPSPSQVLVPHAQSSFFSFPGSSSASVLNDPMSSTLQPSEYALARLRDHAQTEERMAQIKLAKWATDLQRSLRNERDRFEQLEQSKRAQWLLERVGEEVRDGRIVPALPPASTPPRSEKNWAVVRRGSLGRQGGWTALRSQLDPRDPLGLCGLGDDIRWRGMLMLRVLGGVGVVGAVVVAVVRVIGVENEVTSWLEWFTGHGSAS